MYIHTTQTRMNLSTLNGYIGLASQPRQDKLKAFVIIILIERYKTWMDGGKFRRIAVDCYTNKTFESVVKLLYE